jgi:aspartate/methionine/tyrosine aminotransferase
MAAPAPSRRGAVPSFYVMEVMRAAAALEQQGRSVCHLEVGQPSTGAPAGALAAAAEALARSGSGVVALGYTCEAGTPPLRAAVAAMYARRHALAVPVDRCFATTGSSAAFVLAFLAAFDAGDRVAVASPGYPCYVNTLEALGVQPVPLAVDAGSNFQPTVAMLDAAVVQGGPLRGLIVASPSNPCGTMLAPDELFALRAWCRRHGVWLVSDELYHGLVYGDVRDATALEPSSRADAAVAAAALTQQPEALPDEADNVIVVNSLSKCACPVTKILRATLTSN